MFEVTGYREGGYPVKIGVFNSLGEAQSWIKMYRSLYVSIEITEVDEHSNTDDMNKQNNT